MERLPSVFRGKQRFEYVIHFVNYCKKTLARPGADFAGGGSLLLETAHGGLFDEEYLSPQRIIPFVVDGD